jgi:hypothetical protein
MHSELSARSQTAVVGVQVVTDVQVRLVGMGLLFQALKRRPVGRAAQGTSVLRVMSVDQGTMRELKPLLTV